jgi:hypothetical protein
VRGYRLEQLLDAERRRCARRNRKHDLTNFLTAWKLLAQIEGEILLELGAEVSNERGLVEGRRAARVTLEHLRLPGQALGHDGGLGRADGGL